MILNKLLFLFKLVVLPVIIYLYLQKNALASFWVLVLFLSALVVHLFDFYLPRKRMNSFLEPFSDKMLVLGLLLVLVWNHSFSLTLLLLLLLRDLIVGVIRWKASQDSVLIKEINEGKMIIFAEFGLISSILAQEFLNYNELFSFLAMGKVTELVFITLALLLSVFSVIYHGSVYLQGLRSLRKEGKKVETEDLIILANRKSRGFKQRYRRHLLLKFARRRKVRIIYLPDQENMFKGVGNKIGKTKQIIIAGGDGTFESALNYKPFWKKSLGFFPLGAGNALYSFFYKGKRFEYLRSRFRFREIKLDILEINWDKGKRQSLFSSLGIDAEVIRQMKKRSQSGLFDYVLASWKALWHSKADFEIECKVDLDTFNWPNCINLIIGKIPYYGFGVRSLLGEIEENDGKILGISCLNTHSVFLNKALRLWAIILTQLNFDKPPLYPVQGREFKIKSEEPLPLQVGGDFLGYTHNLTAKVVRKQKVLMI